MDPSFSQEQTNAVAAVFESKRWFSGVWHWAREHAAELLCALFLGAMSLNMLTVIARKTITIDETVTIPAAYYHLAAGNFQLVHDHPPLAKIVAGVPLLFVQPNELRPEDTGAEPYSPAAEWAYQERFWTDNRSAFETISFWARVPMIALTLAWGIVIFLFARDLFGARAALLSVALFALEPTVLAHGRVVQTDVPAAFGLTLTCFALYRYLSVRSWQRATFLGMACGVALLSKFSLLIIAPILTVVFVVMLWRVARSRNDRRTMIKHAAVVIGVSLLFVNAAYFFQSRDLSGQDLIWIASSFPDSSLAVERSVRAMSFVLPTDFVLGAYWQLWHSGEGHPAGLMGMYAQKGWWSYFPVAFALKTTLPFLLLSLISIGWAGYQVVRKRDLRFLILLAPFVIYTVFVMFSPINIGVRYYLPAFPFLFMLCGGLLGQVSTSNGRARLAGFLVTIAALGWITFETVRSYPDYIPYMNQLASSRPDWWYLSDSNVEWGDDVKELANYLRDRGETKVRSAVLGGFLLLPLNGIENIELTGPGAQERELIDTRYIAIGASLLNGSTVPSYQVDGVLISEQQRVNQFDAYRRRTPETIIGGSIYVYREHE